MNARASAPMVPTPQGEGREKMGIRIPAFRMTPPPFSLSFLLFPSYLKIERSNAQSL